MEKSYKILELSFSELCDKWEKLPEETGFPLHRIVQDLEAISKRAGMMARYLDEREGHGYGDQGHGSALKAMNRTGKIIWTKAFGYNAFHDLNF